MINVRDVNVFCVPDCYFEILMMLCCGSKMTFCYQLLSSGTGNIML